jgi:hypothetical protein
MELMRDFVDNEKQKDQVVSAYGLNVEDDDVNEDHADLLSVIFMGLEIGRLGAVSYLMSQFRDLNDSAISDASFRDRIQMNGLMREGDVENGWVSMGDMAYETFITMNKDFSASAIIPVQKDVGGWFNVSRSFCRSEMFTDYTSPAEQVAAKVCAKMESLFGKDYWDIDKGVSVRVPCDRKLFSGLELQGIDEEVDNVHEMIKWLKAIHIISPKAGGVQIRKRSQMSQARISTLRYHDANVHTGKGSRFQSHQYRFGRQQIRSLDIKIFA